MFLVFSLCGSFSRFILASSLLINPVSETSQAAGTAGGGAREENKNLDGGFIFLVY